MQQLRQRDDLRGVAGMAHGVDDEREGFLQFWASAFRASPLSR
jgi:hypothetical protein